MSVNHHQWHSRHHVLAARLLHCEISSQIALRLQERASSAEARPPRARFDDILGLGFRRPSVDECGTDGKATRRRQAAIVRIAPYSHPEFDLRATRASVRSRASSPGLLWPNVEDRAAPPPQASSAHDRLAENDVAALLDLDIRVKTAGRLGEESGRADMHSVFVEELQLPRHFFSHYVYPSSYSSRSCQIA